MKVCYPKIDIKLKGLEMDTENTFNNSDFNNTNFGSTGPNTNPGPQINNYYNNTQPTGDLEKPYSIWQWVGTAFLTMIPCVGFILLIVWACSAENKSKKNWAIAQFVVVGILIAVYIVLIIVFGVSIANAIKEVPGILDYAL